MRRSDIGFIVSMLLLLLVIITGLLGYIQSRLEIRQFVPHRYFAYGTLVLAAIHVYLNWAKIWRFLTKIRKKR